MAWKLRKDKLKTDEPEATEQAAPVASPEPTPAEPEATQPVFDLGADATAPEAPTESAPADDLQFFDDDKPDFLEELKRLAAQPEETSQELHEEPISLGTAPIALEPEPVALEPEPVALEPEPLALDAESTAPEPEPSSLGAFTPYQPPVKPGPIITPEPIIAPEPLPEFDPVVAPSSPSLAPEAIALTPTDVEQVEAPVETPIPPDIAPEPVAEAEIAMPIAPEVPLVPTLDVSPEREAVAAGLVTTETDSGVPKVAPFILDAPEPDAPEEAERIHNIVLRLGNLSATYFLVKDVTTVGRPDSSVQNYPDIEVELDDGVSRKHAEIRRQDGQYFLVDVGSTNGTILNGEMLPEEQPVPLRPGDRIRIGERTEMLFE